MPKSQSRDFYSRVLFCLLSVFCVDTVFAQTASELAREQVVAEVGDSVFSKRRVDRELNWQLKKDLSYFDDSQLHLLRTEMLKRIIQRELLLQAAIKKNLYPSSEEIAFEVETIRKESRKSELLNGEFSGSAVEKDSYLKSVKGDIAIKRYLDLIVFHTLKVSDKEVQEIFNNSPSSFTQPEEIRVRHILLKVPKNVQEPQSKEIQEHAEKILALAREEDTDFVQLVKKYSEATNKGKGGDLGFFERGQLNKEFSDAAFSLEAGEISDVVRTRFGFHIIKVEERRGGLVPEFSEVKLRIRADLLRKKRKKLLSEHLKHLRRTNRVITYYQ